MIQDWANTEDAFGETPVSRALKCGHSAAATLILKVSEPPDPTLDTPIHEAARNSRVADVKAAIERGSNLDAVDGYGLTALHWAAINGCLDLAKLLVNRGANINPREETVTDMTPFTLATWLGYRELASFLSQHGGSD
jgi:ankyrin repeat protein